MQKIHCLRVAFPVKASMEAEIHQDRLCLDSLALDLMLDKSERRSNYIRFKTALLTIDLSKWDLML